MITYIIHTSILLALFYLLYSVFLYKETFYKLNRLYLTLTIVFALLLPLISVPEAMSFNVPTSFSESIQPINKVKSAEVFEITNHKASEEEKQLIITDNQTSSTSTSFWNTKNILATIYIAGILVFLITFLIQFVQLFYKKSKLTSFEDGDFRIYELKDDSAPFSFLNWIFVNPSLYDMETFTQILDHEKIHVSQAHFIDKLIAEISVVLFWFNPFTWLYRKSITNNLEFITDSEMLNKGTKKESYQMNLLRLSVPQQALNLTTNYNESFLTTRIKMMNYRKSSAKSSWKYLLLFPLIGLSLATLNEVQANNVQHTEDHITIEENANNGSNKHIDTIPANEHKELNISSHSLDSDKAKQKNKLKSKEKNKKTTKTHSYGKDYSHIKPGHWEGEIHDNKVCIHMNNSKGKGSIWTLGECFPKSNTSPLPIDQEGEFIITKEAGRLVFNGIFIKDTGSGTFDFIVEENFVSFLKQKGITGHKETDMLLLFTNDTRKEFITKVSKKHSLTMKELINIGIHQVDDQYEEYQRIFKKINHNDPTIKEMINMSIHHVDEEFVDMLLTAGFEGLTIKKIISAKIHDVDKRLISSIKTSSLKDVRLKDVIDMSIHNIKGEYLDKIMHSNIQGLTMSRIIEFGIHDVSFDLIATCQNIGLDLSASKYIEMSIHGATSNHVQSLYDMGFHDLTGSEIINTKVHDVSIRFAQKVIDIGYTDITISRLVEFMIHDVDSQYIQDLKNENLEYSARQLVEAKIHNVNINYIKTLKSLNIEGLTPNTLREGMIHNVTPSFIKKARKKGHKFNTLKEYQQLPIEGM